MEKHKIIKRQDEIISEHKNYQKEILLIRKFIKAVFNVKANEKLEGELIKKYIEIQHPTLLEKSQKHIDELAGFTIALDETYLFDKGKDCVYRTISFCVNEDLN